ncbi:MAG: hypothetical protein ACI80M_000575 [Gammaproteobacteria bacterium]|jgi:Tfp pilus assembly protein PilN|tara:strand:+ start:1406 stop:2185 length:780 start_codon:yes stop_codon:yes gene_type:complete
MSLTHRRFRLLAGGVILALAYPVTGISQSVDDVLAKQQSRTKLSQQSQQKIDAVVDETRGLEDQYKAVLKEIEGLQVYNTLLERQIIRQDMQMEQLMASIDGVEVINRQIVPLMTKMVDSLEQFVELDVPFLLEERRNRVAGLEETLERQDVTVAEKFRKVTEAYQIENEFGRTIESYKGELDIDGAVRQVDFLRIGRIGLVYQSEDGKLSGSWDQRNRTWIDLGSGYRSEIRKGIRIARKEIAPELLMMPVDAPEANQ